MEKPRKVTDEELKLSFRKLVELTALINNRPSWKDMNAEEQQAFVKKAEAIAGR